MNNSEIQLYFPHSEQDDINDLYEERLFEFKQFFISKTIISKVFSAKIEKLKKFEKAYLSLTKSCNETCNSLNVVSNKFKSNEILTVFNDYQIVKNEFKTGILNAKNSDEIIQIIYNLLESNSSYLLKWPDTLVEDDIIISKEPNPMDILSAIIDFNKKGGKEFSDIISLKNICPKIIQIESKRLSLHLNIDNNG